MQISYNEIPKWTHNGNKPPPSRKRIEHLNNTLSRKSSCSTTQKGWGVSYTRLAFGRAFQTSKKVFKSHKQDHIRKNTW